MTLKSTLDMFLRICSLVMSFVWLINGENACTESSYGTEFIFGFVDLPYYNSSTVFTDPGLSIRIATKRSAYVYLTLPTTASASKTPTYVTEGYSIFKTKELTFNSTFINRYQDTGSSSSIKIRSNAPISVLAVYRVNSYVVSNPILTVTSLSTSYIIPSYPPNQQTHSQSQLLIVALNDSTNVHIKNFDTSFTQSLNANETYVYQSREDISGTSVTSDYPVAVFASVTFGYDYRHSGPLARDIFMQVPPIGKDAFHFIVPSLPNEVRSYKIRVYATHIGARVEVHSTSDSVKHMHVYENIFYEYSTKGTSALEIMSDSPIMVVQIGLNSNGDAMYMTNIPAVSQFLTNYLMDNSHSTYVITVKYEEALGLLVDGKPLLHDPELIAYQTRLGNYTVFTLNGRATSHYSVSHVGNEPFGLLVYENIYKNFGFGPRHLNTYAYYAGMEFNEDCVHTTLPSQIIDKNLL